MARIVSIKFENPPISEVVIGIYFDREIPPLRSEHVGLFWGQVRQDFPNIQQQTPVAAPALQPFQQIFISSDSWMPRFWLEASDDSTLMQIQKNAFLFNWRKKETDYPHFDALKAAFDKNKKRFFKFLSDELSEAEPKAQLAELNYVNVIDSCEYWKGPQDTANVIPRFRLPIPEGSEMEPSDFHQATSQQLAADLTLNTTVRSGRSTLAPANPVLIIEYRATGLLPDTEVLDSWFGRAHDAIGHCFTEMTSQNIQKTHWKRR
jgi:uncharacterized protein (TIGR04255 family)